MNKITLLILTATVSVCLTACGSSLTAETPGQIKSSVIDRDTKTSKKKTSSNKTKKKTKTSIETEIEYSYSVGGKTFDGYSEKDGDVVRDFQTGATVVVCYNPANPTESDVFAQGTKCG